MEKTKNNIAIKSLAVMGVILLVLVVLIVGFLIYKNSLENNERVNKIEEFIWSSPIDSFTTDFIVGENGLIYLKAKVNDVNGLLLFDTGCDYTSVTEKLLDVKNNQLHPITVTDAKGLKQTKNLVYLKRFKLGSIEIKRLHVFPADTATWTDSKGCKYKQDSILGIIGNNIISKFIWDFDLVKHRVTISNSKSYCETIPDSMSISLISNNKHQFIPISINGESRMIMLDFGCVYPLVITNPVSILKESGTKINFSEKVKSTFNHLDSTNSSSIMSDFLNVKLGAHEYKQIMYFLNDNVNVLGIPFIWSFKRVVLDFNKSKVYFITENEIAGGFGVNSFSRKSISDRFSIFTTESKPEGMPLIIENVIEQEKSSIKYVIYGKAKWYTKNKKSDKVICLDSLLLPNGKIQHGPYTINFN